MRNKRYLNKPCHDEFLQSIDLDDLKHIDHKDIKLLQYLVDEFYNLLFSIQHLISTKSYKKKRLEVQNENVIKPFRKQMNH